MLAVCQPAEETGAGAEGMIADGFAARFPRPDVILGQHVARAPVGFVGTRPGVLMAASDALRVRMFGRGGHGAMPELSVDPVVMAAATVLRLQTIVSRETAAAASAVVTVGVLRAGTKENVIAEEAMLGTVGAHVGRRGADPDLGGDHIGSSRPRRRRPARLGHPRSS